MTAAITQAKVVTMVARNQAAGADRPVSIAGLKYFETEWIDFCMVNTAYQQNEFSGRSGNRSGQHLLQHGNQLLTTHRFNQPTGRTQLFGFRLLGVVMFGG